MPPAPTLATVGGLQFAVGFAGQLANDPLASRVESRYNEAATGIDPGDAVCRGVATTPGVIGNCKAAVTGGVVIGIAVRANSEANAVTVNSPNFTYAQYKTIPVLKAGDIYCLASEAVTEGDVAVAVVGAAGMGSATTGAANGTTRLAAPGMVWQTTTASGAIGLLRVQATNL